MEPDVIIFIDSWVKYNFGDECFDWRPLRDGVGLPDGAIPVAIITEAHGCVWRHVPVMRTDLQWRQWKSLYSEIMAKVTGLRV